MLMPSVRPGDGPPKKDSEKCTPAGLALEMSSHMTLERREPAAHMGCLHVREKGFEVGDMPEG